MNIYEPIKILSDGDKIVIISNGVSYTLEGAIVTRFDVNVQRDSFDVAIFGDNTKQIMAGPAYTNINLSLQGGMVAVSEKTDVFNPAKITEYAKQINQEVKEIALKRSLDF